MTYTGLVNYRQVKLDGIDVPFETVCLHHSDSDNDYILRFPDQKWGLIDARLTSLIGKRVEALGVVMVIPGYPLPMFYISTLKLL